MFFGSKKMAMALDEIQLFGDLNGENIINKPHHSWWWMMEFLPEATAADGLKILKKRCRMVTQEGSP